MGGSLKDTASEVNARGGHAIPVVCDHSNDQEIKDLFDKISSEQSKLDVLVNNAFSGVHVGFQPTVSALRFLNSSLEMKSICCRESSKR